MPHRERPSVTLLSSDRALRDRIERAFAEVGYVLVEISNDPGQWTDGELLIVDGLLHFGSRRFTDNPSEAEVQVIYLTDDISSAERDLLLRAGAADQFPRDVDMRLLVARSLRLLASCAEVRAALSLCDDDVFSFSQNSAAPALIAAPITMVADLPTLPHWNLVAYDGPRDLFAEASGAAPDVILMEGRFAERILPALRSGHATRPARVVTFASSVGEQIEHLRMGASDVLFPSQSPDETALRIDRQAQQKCLVDQARAHLRSGVDMSYSDGLTGLRNRRFFEERFGGMFQRARLTGRPLSVLMFDIDGFKQVNARFGHAGGDEILKEFSDRLTANVRSNDLVSRYGGEEFAVATPNADMNVAARAAERIRSAIASPGFSLKGGEIAAITVSIGVATLSPHDRRTEDIIARADAALFRAKGLGKNRVSRAA